jgi:hypothetical protein
MKWMMPGAVAIMVLSAGAAPAAGGLFARKDKRPPPPEWCFCARVCQQSQPGFARRDAAGDVIAHCPQLNDELVYDNRARCQCAAQTRRAAPERRLSPNR